MSSYWTVGQAPLGSISPSCATTKPLLRCNVHTLNGLCGFKAWTGFGLLVLLFVLGFFHSLHNKNFVMVF